LPKGVNLNIGDSFGLKVVVIVQVLVLYVLLCEYSAR